MKLYAKQVPFDVQESPLYLGDDMFPDDIIVYGNKHYNEHTNEDFDNALKTLREGCLAYRLEALREFGYASKAEAVLDYLPPMNRKEYTDKEMESLVGLVERFAVCPDNEEDIVLCDVYSIVVGKRYRIREINGSSQGDWNNVFYPVDSWDDNALRVFEREYFNEGTEWIVDGEGFDPETEDPSEIMGCSTYCTSWDDEGIKKEIAEAASTSSELVNPEDVVLYKFTGYIQTPTYTQA